MAVQYGAGTREASRKREPRDRIRRKAWAESSRHRPQQAVLERAKEVVEHSEGRAGPGLWTRRTETAYVIFSSFIRLPLRIAIWAASLRNDAFKTRSTVTGQLNGTSVP